MRKCHGHRCEQYALICAKVYVSYPLRGDYYERVGIHNI